MTNPNKVAGWTAVLVLGAILALHLLGASQRELLSTAVMGLLLIGALWWGTRDENQRVMHQHEDDTEHGERLRRLGESLGLEHDPSGQYEPHLRHPHDFFDPAGQPKWTQQVLTGTVERGGRLHEVELGELAHTREGYRHLHPYIVVHFDCVGLPRMTIRPRGLAGWLNSPADKGEDVEFQDMRFNEKYVVTSDNPGLAHALFGHRARRHVEVAPLDGHWHLEFLHERALSVGPHRRLEVDEYEVWLRWLLDLFDAWPNDVLAKLPTRADAAAALEQRYRPDPEPHGTT